MGRKIELLNNVWLTKEKPQKAYLWIVHLPDITFQNNFNEEISARILGATIPFNSFESNKIPFGNSYQYTTRSVDIGNLTLELLELEDGKTVDYFIKWQTLITPEVVIRVDNPRPNVPQRKKPQNTFSVPGKYKKEIILFRMDDDKKNVVKFTYKGCFPLKIGDSNHTYDTNDVIKHTITFSVDSFSFEILGS